VVWLRKEDNGRSRPDPGCRPGETGGLTLWSDERLLAAVIFSDPPSISAQGASRLVIEKAGGLTGLVDIPVSELLDIKGIGPARAAAVASAIELGRRALSGRPCGERMGSSAEVHSALWPRLAYERIEVFSCAMVDARLRLINAEVISRGTLTASIVHPREAFRPAIRHSASGVIFAHNHPSGDPTPSDEDRRITGRLEEAGRIIGIPVLDHVIIGTGNEYYSFADAGELMQCETGYRGMVLR
jgi:DNA repair protein RadC